MEWRIWLGCVVSVSPLVRNLLGQIISVTQSGQTRTFSYDSLGQLYSSSQPEYSNASGGQGAVTFAYDADGNLMRRTDSNGKGTCYSYDQLNRPTSIVYYLGAQTGACSSIPASAYDPYTSAAAALFTAMIPKTVCMWRMTPLRRSVALSCNNEIGG